MSMNSNAIIYYAYEIICEWLNPFRGSRRDTWSSTPFTLPYGTDTFEGSRSEWEWLKISGEGNKFRTYSQIISVAWSLSMLPIWPTDIRVQLTIFMWFAQSILGMKVGHLGVVFEMHRQWDKRPLHLKYQPLSSFNSIVQIEWHNLLCTCT